MEVHLAGQAMEEVEGWVRGRSLGKSPYKADQIGPCPIRKGSTSRYGTYYDINRGCWGAGDTAGLEGSF